MSQHALVTLEAWALYGARSLNQGHNLGNLEHPFLKSYAVAQQTAAGLQRGAFSIRVYVMYQFSAVFDRLSDTKTVVENNLINATGSRLEMHSRKKSGNSCCIDAARRQVSIYSFFGGVL
jgi:hypothetical protein